MNPLETPPFGIDLGDFVRVHDHDGEFWVVMIDIAEDEEEFVFFVKRQGVPESDPKLGPYRIRDEGKTWWRV